ncbi:MULTISPECIES: RluA family pseudouridine synthase [Dehalobacter]|jgi:23S rRNA pseudouridine1911/1915/1917 synthase|uniref:Pseudouridine synthase n=2 Tax=Dehalobacter restrictus TaxID=55583 RepID=A0A857DL21_9FIRM|nr:MULTISPECIES: RluA family pseudouridine synthase [Dehalobacter]AHF10235.1 pseudouridine synthase [Dehalobacter restrictus DSM 9455]MCG1025646.1 RluA family pseudouridine synthase [Dehalobacter sp.]MDJ0306266.1 RluA family pseudouridine synthase [Dehalobacter sp.]OCZ51455.1 RNA pseudouridine synthase [Dehalobacter sp. TeCB1]QHA00826.1 RluA family pseudouridine synthase [Dehalobacter restrictus]
MNANKLFTYTLTPEDDGRKYQDILLRRFHFSRKVLQKLKVGENVWIDGKFTYLTARGKTGQTLVVNILEEEPATVSGETLPIEILFEDEIFLAVNKPPGQVIHPNSRYRTGTLANAVVGYWESKGETRPFRPVSRIDRNTSGVVLIAKSRYAHQQLAALSIRNKVEKKYLGIVEGNFPLEQGEWPLPIRLKSGSKIVREVHPDGQSALTLFRTLQHYPGYTLMEFTLVTGRTHQIRVHAQAAGHPLLGDDLYSGSMKYMQRQALHCYSYGFTHPLNMQPLQIQAPVPADIAMLIQSKK